MVDHIGLRVKDIKASARFYTAALAPLGHVAGSAGEGYAGSTSASASASSPTAAWTAPTRASSPSATAWW